MANMESSTTASEFIPENSQAQYTQGTNADTELAMSSISHTAPTFLATHLQSVPGTALQLSALPNVSIAQNNSTIPPHSTFQIDLHPSTTLSQADNQQLSMLWFSPNSLRSHQATLQGLANVASADPESVTQDLTPTTDSLVHVSVSLPSYNAPLRAMVTADEHIHASPLTLSIHTQDHSSTMDASQPSQLHRNELITQSGLSLATFEGVRAVGTIYSIAPSQGTTSDVTTASVNSGHVAHDSLAHSANTNEYCNIDELNSIHIPTKVDIIPVAGGHSALHEVVSAESELQSEVMYRNSTSDVSQPSGTVQIPVIGTADEMKLEILQNMCVDRTAGFMEITSENNVTENRREEQVTYTQSKDVNHAPEKKLEGFVETVECYKCKLCPFISLSNKGVQQHVKRHHAEAVIQTDESEEDAELDGSASGGSEIPEYTQESSRETDLESKEIMKIIMQPTAKGEKFICGKCRKGYLNLDVCRTHMTKDHGLKLENMRVEKFDQSATEDKEQVDKSKRTQKGRLRRPCSDLGKENSSRRDRAVRTRRKQKAPRKMQSVDESSSEEVTVVKKKQLKGKKAVATAVSKASSGNGSVEPRRDIPKITASLKKRGRPKGSKNTGITALKRKNPKLKVEEELGYRCDLDGCAIRMKSIDNLDYHRRCHVDNDVTFTCPECHEKFDHWRNISVHLWRSHVIDMELFACDQCSYKTYSFSKLMNMHKRIHSEERPFLCDTCGKGFKTSKQLRNHKVIHLDKRRQRSFRSGECDVCHRFFSDKRMLRVHKDTVHNKLRPFLCNYCGYAASCRSTLKMHMRQHTGEKPFSCTHCSYRTADHNSLRRHKMRHSGEKPYKCPFCPYACIQSSTYKTHLKNKHPGQDEGLMYSCNLCNFRTIKKDNYTTHMADHKAGTIPINTTEQAVEMVESAKECTVVSPDHGGVLIQTTHLDGLPANMTAAQVMFSTIEDIRQKIAIAAQSYPLEVGPNDRYPILLGQLKGNQLEHTLVHIDANHQLDPNQLVQQEFIVPVHETVIPEDVQSLVHPDTMQPQDVVE